MSDDNWTATTWYAIAIELETAASNRKLPARVRRGLMARAEAAWITGDWMRGITQADWEAECAIYQAEDEAMVAANMPTVTQSAPQKQLALELA